MSRRAVSVAAGAAVVVAALLLVGGGCSFYIGDLLEEARANIASEGEGEGDGGEGDTGEGEGEGEIDDDDPACEAEERLLVVRDDRAGGGLDALQVYDLQPGSFRRRFAEGNDLNVDLVNDDDNAETNGYGASSVALGSDDRLYVVGDRFLYQLRKSTLVQQDIDGGPMLTLAAFSSFTSMQLLGEHVLIAGTADLLDRAEDAPVGSAPLVLSQHDTYGRSVAFNVDSTGFVVVVGAFGYVLYTDTGAGGAPAVGPDIDVESDTARIHSFGGVQAAQKGVAFDATTRSLLIGDLGRVIVAPESDGFDASLGDGSGDLVIADAEQVSVLGIAARGGSAWVLLGRSTNNLLKIDLNTSPPTILDQTTVDTNGLVGSITVGCRRVVVAGSAGIKSVARDDLSPTGNLGVADVSEVRLVRRIQLGLAGDDGT